jgi:hypothetical protein
MNYVKERPLVSGLVIGLIVGILIGWLGIGWGLWPVEYTDSSPVSLAEVFRADYVKMVAKSYSQTLNQEKAAGRMQRWAGNAEYTCQLANAASDTAENQELQALAQILSPGIDCAAVETAAAETVAPEAEDEPTSLGILLGRLCGALLLALLLVGGAFYLIRQRRAPKEDAFEPMPTADPVVAVSAPGGRTIALAQFPTEFNIGHDTYDESFSIETATGDFLGECGMGISEAIGVGDPKKVTAFEVWLFDKNDIRTITKVIMSEHAYHDDALRAKLAPKGEAALARPGETVVLETASLIINAHIVEIEYGTGELPPQSFFNRIVVELATWAKETEGADLDDFTF